MKKSYKQLQKKLEINFTTKVRDNSYSLIGGIREWVGQSKIKPTDKHIDIICRIFDNSIPYPYQQAHRLEILNYLKEHKYKQFKKL